MIPGLLALLRALGTPNLSDLRKAGLDALKAALAERLMDQREAVITKALRRLEGDNDVAKLSSAATFTDKDGVDMSGRQYFVHQGIFSIARAIVPSGEIADLIRDDMFAAFGMEEADELLAGVTDGRTATDIIFNRMLEQAT